MSKGRELERVSARRSGVSRPPGHDSGSVRASGRTARVRWSQRRGVKGVFAVLATVGFAGAYLAPTGAALAEAAPVSMTSYDVATENVQSIRVGDDAVAAAVERASYEVYVKPTPTPTPTPPPEEETSTAGLFYSGGGTQTEWLTAAGIAPSDWGYVEYIVHKESSWNPNATNASSGACGLVQALPCSKVPGNGYNPIDNLRWANGYATGRYGSWAGAYDFWISNHWW